ncbi:GNAT family N-acetyltransferase [Actinokineospora guangxiensis]|uniref:GNAT family N-acetyltransferase n=1 Tax=Actinokineospora guangxiensis TaxID=1490288 RepID=A0ABW0EWE5_9PSEU
MTSLLLRADAGPGVGVGHLARCAAVAEEALARGWDVTLAGTFTGADWLLAQLPGVEVRPDWAPADVVHIDHYGEITPSPSLVVSMEDGPFGRRRADIAVDANLARSDRPDDGTPLVLRGPVYAPLRSAVRAARGLPRPARERPRVVVSMGGGAAAEHVEAAVAAILSTGVPADVLAISAQAISARPGVEYSGPRTDLPALLADADLVVSAAGVTLLELCCIGVPTALVVIAENQRPGYTAALDRGVAVGLPDLPALLADPAARARTAAAARRAVDGHGARRLLNAVAGITLRRATPADSDLLLTWRNDPTTRRWSLTQDPVPVEDHRRWLAKALTDRVLLVAEERGTPVGTVRFDPRAPGEAEVSITLAPTARGRSLARPVLEAAHDELPGVRFLALIHRDNHVSRRLFAAAGYRPAGLPPDGPFEVTVREP